MFLKVLSTILCTGILINTYAAELTVTTRYQEVDTSDIKKNEKVKSIDIESGIDITSDKGIEKTILVTQMGEIFLSTLEEADKLCKHTHRTTSRPGHPNPDKPVIKCETAAKKLSQKLTEKVNKLNASALTQEVTDQSLMEFITLGHKLAKNLLKMKRQIIRPLPRRSSRSTTARTSSPSGTSRSLNVTVGGAQSVEYFIKTVNDGMVPTSKSFTLEGFISHFDLPVGTETCKSILCIEPVYKIDSKAKKLYVQLGMDTNVTEKSFKRKKLNLSVVLDTSGSMSATDNTEIQRIEWAKRALIKTINSMNKDDVLSIVLFNTKSKILITPTTIKDKESLIKKISEIQAEGSTNLEAGLRDAFNLVSEKFIKGYENRVILISDAGANTGSTSEADLLKLVSDFAAENIGLTAIGLGLNFNQDLVHGITMSKGSNYLFVNSGKGLKNYFDQFKFLVSPLAYNFKAKLKFSNKDIKLVKAYGVPAKKDSPVQDLLDIRTLFLTSDGSGGGILLEYSFK